MKTFSWSNWAAVLSAHILYLLFALFGMRWIWVQWLKSPGILQPVYLAVVSLFLLLTLFRPRWGLCVYLVSSTVFSGLYALFPGVFLGWYANRLVRRKSTLPGSAPELYALGLCGALFASLLYWQLRIHGFEVLYAASLKTYWGVDTRFFPLEFAMMVANGLMFLCIALKELPEGEGWKSTASFFALGTLGFMLLYKILYFPKLLFLFLLVPYWEFVLAGAFVCAVGSIPFGRGIGLAVRAAAGLPVAFYLFQASSRTSWIALATALGAGVAPRLGYRRVLAVMAIAVMGVVAFNALPRETVSSFESRIAQTSPAVASGVQDLRELMYFEKKVRDYSLGEESYFPDGVLSRFMLWERVAGVLMHSPLVGSGAGTYYSCSAQFAQTPFGRQFREPENAHNYFLQLAADLGIPAIVLLGFLLARLISAGRTAMRLAPDHASQCKWLLLGALFLGISNMWDHPLMMPNQHVFFWSMLALAACGAGREALPPIRRVDWKVLGAVCALSAIGYALALLSPPVCG